jgi:CBS domain-containing protein
MARILLSSLMRSQPRRCVGEDMAALANALREVGPVPILLLWLGPINIMLALFNLIPGFPFDGGRVLRSILWATTGDLAKLRVEPTLTLDRFVNDWVMRGEQQAFPVEVQGRVLGIVRLADVRRLSPSKWHVATVAEVMQPIGELPALPPNARAEQALDELARQDVEQVPVVDHDHVVGLVSRGDLMRWLALRSGIGGRSGTSPTAAMAR